METVLTAPGALTTGFLVESPLTPPVRQSALDVNDPADQTHEWLEALKEYLTNSGSETDRMTLDFIEAHPDQVRIYAAASCPSFWPLGQDSGKRQVNAWTIDSLVFGKARRWRLTDASLTGADGRLYHVVAVKCS